MTEIQPPRVAEAILESLGAVPAFRDAVIGDMSQEFSERALTGGERAARRWYWRETLWAVPHLIGNWLQHARLRDARRRLSVAGLAYALTAVLGMTVSFTLVAVAGVFHLNVGALPAWVFLLLRVGSVWMLPVFAGWIAASLDDDAPMLAALAAGVLWAALLLATGVVVDLRATGHLLGISVLARSIAMTLGILAALTGGAMRLRRRVGAAISRN